MIVENGCPPRERAPKGRHDCRKRMPPQESEPRRDKTAARKPHLKSLPIEARIMPSFRDSSRIHSARKSIAAAFKPSKKINCGGLQPAAANHAIPSGFARHSQRKEINCGGLQPAAANHATPSGLARHPQRKENQLRRASARRGVIYNSPLTIISDLPIFARRKQMLQHLAFYHGLFPWH